MLQHLQAVHSEHYHAIVSAGNLDAVGLPAQSATSAGVEDVANDPIESQNSSRGNDREMA